MKSPSARHPLARPWSKAHTLPKAPVRRTFHIPVSGCGTDFEFIARARLGGPWGNRRGGESREQTIANGVYAVGLLHGMDCVDTSVASRKIQSVAVAMRISEAVATAAVRTYTLAVEHKFTKGRKSTLVVGVCLYVACRQQTTQNRFMLIDFADILQVNLHPIIDKFCLTVL